MKNKKGAELSMNVIIIAILVILVLVIVASFFAGGFSQLYDKIRGVFRGSIPDDASIAVSSCESNCLFAQDSSPSQKARSSYCTSTWKYDSDGDGKADELHHCWSSWIRQDCPGVQTECLDPAVEPLV